jgi:hypothetical protein
MVSRRVFRLKRHPSRQSSALVGHLKELLPPKTKVAAVEHHNAVPHRDMPAFMAKACCHWLESRAGIDRDRGTPRGATPPTPPGIRVPYHGGSTELGLGGRMVSGKTERLEIVIA